MSLHDPKNEQEAIDWLGRQLGCGVVVVELTEDHIRDAFYEAIRWWISRRGLLKSTDIAISNGIVEYKMPDDTDAVVEVVYPGTSSSFLFSTSVAAGIYAADIDYGVLPSISGIEGGMFYGTFSQMLSSYETGARVLSAERAWEYDQHRKVLQVFPSTKVEGTARVFYISTELNAVDPVPPATEPVNEFARLQIRDRDLILRYAKTALKETLGRIRGKYSGGLPSASGQVSLDGDTLLGEAQQEREMLNQEIMELSNPVPMIVG